MREQVTSADAKACDPPTFGRLLCLDLGARRVGVAVSDESQTVVRPLKTIARASWKKLLREVCELQRAFDASALVIGLPLTLEGGEGAAAQAARRLARNFARSLSIPVFLQDERLTSRASEEILREEGFSGEEIRARIDALAAAIILRDFLAESQNRKANHASDSRSS